MHTWTVKEKEKLKVRGLWETCCSNLHMCTHIHTSHIHTHSQIQPHTLKQVHLLSLIFTHTHSYNMMSCINLIAHTHASICQAKSEKVLLSKYYFINGFYSMHIHPLKVYSVSTQNCINVYHKSGLVHFNYMNINLMTLAIGPSNFHSVAVGFCLFVYVSWVWYCLLLAGVLF